MTVADLTIEAAAVDLVALDTLFTDAAEEALILREALRVAVEYLHQARQHALRQGRVIQRQREEIQQLMGIAEPVPVYDEHEAEPWR